MTAAIFALIGALLGVLGTLATEFSRARTEDSRSRRETLRLTCADFTSAVTRMRGLARQVKEQSENPVPRAMLREVTLDARVYYERLRLTSTSRDVQKAGRYALRYAYGIARRAEGMPPRDDELERDPILLTHDWLLELYAVVRRELGVPNPNGIFREPEEWLGWTDLELGDEQPG